MSIERNTEKLERKGNGTILNANDLACHSLSEMKKNIKDCYQYKSCNIGDIRGYITSSIPSEHYQHGKCHGIIPKYNKCVLQQARASYMFNQEG